MSKKMAAWLRQQQEQAGQAKFGNGTLVLADMKVGDQIVMLSSCYLPPDEIGTVESVDRSVCGFPVCNPSISVRFASQPGGLLVMRDNGLRFCEAVRT